MPKINFGLSRQEFFDKYYDKKWYLQRNSFTPDKFDWTHLDDSLFAWEPKDKEIRLFKGGPMPLESFTESYAELNEFRTRIVKDKLYRSMLEGATLVLNKLQQHSPIINDYSMTVAQFSGEKTNVNAYAAFGGDGSFGKHWDTHDVFVLQLMGRKHWKLYQPTFEKPLAHQTSAAHKHECPEEPVLDTILEAGDLLYIPRGWWHEGLPLENEPTFHIAVGTFPNRVSDYLNWICTTQLSKHVEGRLSLNFNLNNTNALSLMTEKVIELLNNPENFQLFYEAVAENQRVRSRFSLADILPNQASDTDVNKSFLGARLNTFIPPPTDKDKPLVVNGFKLNVDAQSRDFITEIGNNHNNKEVYTFKQRKLLEHLSKHDVVELLGK